jgi:predicted nucleic acid-binding protein
MKGFLLDTNIPSELIRVHPERRVVEWVRAADDQQLFLSVVTIGEISKGFTIHPDSERRAQLHHWLDHTLRPWFAGRILPINEPVARRWGVLEGRCQLQGTPLNAADGLIAATALEHDLTIVTRNAKDFRGLGVGIFNPWE